MFVYGITDKGAIRAVNQDGIFLSGSVGTGAHSEIKISPELPAMVYVADGVGGVQDGSVAVNAMMAYSLRNAYPKNSADIKEYLYSMNAYVCRCAGDLNIDTASTIAGVLITDKEVISYNIGDSRVFSINNGYLQQLSTDDTVFGLSGEERDENANVKPPLLQYIGKPTLETDCHIQRSATVKALLICSDGLTDMVEFDDIEDIMEKYPAPIEMVHMLYDKAIENGGQDNISIIYIKLEDEK